MDHAARVAAATSQSARQRALARERRDVRSGSTRAISERFGLLLPAFTFRRAKTTLG
jgi:hypothetical protein